MIVLTEQIEIPASYEKLKALRMRTTMFLKLTRLCSPLTRVCSEHKGEKHGKLCKEEKRNGVPKC